MHPAARAFLAGGLSDGDGEAREVHTSTHDRALGRFLLGHGDIGDDEELSKVHAGNCLHSLGGSCVHCGERYVRLERFADAFVGSRGFEHAVHIRADFERGLPLGHFILGKRIFGIRLRHLVKEHVSCVVLCAVRHLKPDLVAREREDRREDFGHGVEDHPQRALRRLTDRRVLAVAVEMILDNIEIQA